MKKVLPLFFYADNGNITSIGGVGTLIYGGGAGVSPYEVTGLTPEPGQSFQVHYRYDPWGRLVNPSTGAPYAPGSEPTLFLGRGYTGHEHLPCFGLINANARLYDPLLGRFLSPDPYVQDPDFSQNYNRYSYCLNNPLKYSDPSGEILTWNIGNYGFSLGLNYGLFGFGVNVGWLDGFSLGIYGELGPRLGGNGLGYGATISQSLDYNFKYDNFTTTSSAGLYASLGCFTASAGVSHTYDFGSNSNSCGWNAGIGMGFGDQISNLGPYVGYGSSGWSYGLAGYYDPKSAYTLSKGAQSVGLNASDPVPTTDDYLLLLQKYWYPDAPMSNVLNYSVEDVPTEYANKMASSGANAMTVPDRCGNILSGNSSVYFSDRAFLSARQLYIAMGHEFVHVSNYITAKNLGWTYGKVNNSIYVDLTEYWAYSYEREYTHSTMNSFDMQLIVSKYGSETVALFYYGAYPWYLSRNYPFK